MSSHMDPIMKHAQVAGKISYINRLLENIDPLSQVDAFAQVRKTTFRWKDATMEEVMEASKNNQCPTLDELLQQSMVFQELNRVVDLCKPFQVRKELLGSLYKQFANERDLFKSSFHHILNNIESLDKALLTTTGSKKYFLKAMFTTLQSDLAEQGVGEENPNIHNSIKKLMRMLELNEQDFTNQYTLFNEFMSSQADDFPFQVKLDSMVQKELVRSLIENLSSALISNTLKEKLSAYIEPGEVSKALMDNINHILAQNEQLKAAAKVRLGDHKLDERQVTVLFADAVPTLGIDEALKYTQTQRDVSLLKAAYPHSAKYIEQSVAGKSGAEITMVLRQFDFLRQLSANEALDKLKHAGAVEHAALMQLSQAMLVVVKPEMTIQEISNQINAQAEYIGKHIKQRKEKLNLLGFGLETFGRVEEVLRNYKTEDSDENRQAFAEFYLAIRAAKTKYFSDNGNPASIKQIEEIDSKAVKAFFAECCGAGKVAADKLSNNRSALARIVDVLESIGNIVIYCLSLGSTPKFFKPARTAADDLAHAVKDVKGMIDRAMGEVKPEAPRGAL